MNYSVAGIAEQDGKFLIALRKPGTSIGVKWEFPGGKLEEGESPEEALVREYKEELGVKIKVDKRLCEGDFSNGDKKYRLLAYRISLLEHNFISPEHQQIKWAEPGELSSLDFPDSDRIIVDYLLSR